MFTWDPPREAFYLPYFDFPILWYGLFFASSFYLGYYIFLWVVSRYFRAFPEVLPGEMVDSAHVLGRLAEEKGSYLGALLTRGEKVQSVSRLRVLMNRFIQDKSNWYELARSTQKGKKEPCKGFFRLPKSLTLRLTLESAFSGLLLRIEQRGAYCADRLLTVVMVCTVVGARMGHLLFYQSPSFYLQDPMRIFRIWEGGLASHGAATAILIGVYLFARFFQPQKPILTFFTIVDMLTVPAAFIGGAIRVGNFFNQELLGRPTNLPWGVAFGHPMDGSLPWVVRHPVQLYEAGFYFLLFVVLSVLVRKTSLLFSSGKLSGIFFVGVFLFRFFIEFFKEKQSIFTADWTLTMGQMLSIPFCFLGIFCLLKTQIPFSRTKL